MLRDSPKVPHGNENRANTRTLYLHFFLLFTIHISFYYHPGLVLKVPFS